MRLDIAKLRAIANNNTTTIWYKYGMRGNSIYRILAAHPEVYWNASLQKHSEELLSSPLELPETVAGFNPNIYLGQGRNPSDIDLIGKWKFYYATYHATSLLTDDNFLNIVRSWLISNSYINKILFSCSHPPWFWHDYPISIDKFMNLDDKPHIWLYGTFSRSNLAYPDPESNIRYYAPSPNILAYNLNIDALYSTDYITFETEYFKLLAHFNLTSRLNAVRAFILLVLEREKYISTFIKDSP
jgi:hypothetical protein